MMEFKTIPVGELKDVRRGKYWAYVEHAIANPGMAVLVPGCKSVYTITRGRFNGKVSARMLKGEIYVYTEAK